MSVLVTVEQRPTLPTRSVGTIGEVDIEDEQENYATSMAVYPVHLTVEEAVVDEACCNGATQIRSIKGNNGTCYCSGTDLWGIVCCSSEPKMKNPPRNADDTMVKRESRFIGCCTIFTVQVHAGEVLTVMSP
jgi:hypothetical protein